jgi:hypothetical protein
MDYIGVSPKVLEEVKENNKKYIKHSKVLNAQSITPFEEQAPLPKMAKLLTGFDMIGKGAEAVYKKSSSNGGCCGGAIPREEMPGQTLQAGAKRGRKMKGKGLSGGGMIEGNVEELEKLEEGEVIHKDDEAHILLETIINEKNHNISSAISDLYVYYDKRKLDVPFKKIRALYRNDETGNKSYSEQLKKYKDGIYSFKYPFGVNIHLISYFEKFDEEKDNNFMFKKNEVGKFSESEFKKYLFEGTEYEGGKKKRVKKAKKVSKKEVPEMAVIKICEGGRKKRVKKVSKKEKMEVGAGLSGGKKKRAPTEWNKFVQEQRKANPEKSLKEVLQLSAKLYKK